MASLNINKNYVQFLNQLKIKIKKMQIRAALAVNQEVIGLYWHIGKQILEKQKQTKWGESFLDALSHDLRSAFPDTQGFSVTNLKRMRLFAQNYPNLQFGAQAVPQIEQQVVAQLPWGHIIRLLQRVKNIHQRDWYAKQALENGWSIFDLQDYIKNKLYERQAIPENKVSNFSESLPEPQLSIAQELLKNPYNFDFLGLQEDAHEREIERASIKYITKFLLELGKGFAFVGSQVPIDIDDHEYFIDMLFYHLKLRCYVIIELKATPFKPDHAGQLNFYLNVVDDKFKDPKDNSTIGLLLCKTNNKVVAEYSLKGIKKPIGVSEYQLTKSIPEKLKTELPTIEEIEYELNQ